MNSDDDDTSRAPRHPFGRHPAIVPVGLLLLAAAALLIDVPVAQAMKSPGAPRFVRDLLDKAEPFGHGIGIVYVVLTAMVLDHRQWRLGARLWGCALTAGLLANVTKLLVDRLRPRDLELVSTAVMDTFGPALPLLRGGGGHSFPSAHTASAVALAWGLSRLYPQGRWWFALLAAAVGLQRVVASAHFPSDVFAGAALGWVIGAIMCRGTAIDAALTRHETPITSAASTS